MRNLLFVALGMFLMYILLKILSDRGVTSSSDSTAAFVALSKTGEVMNLVKTNEFREVAKTPEFRKLVTTLADEQINALSKSLVGSIKTF